MLLACLDLEGELVPRALSEFARDFPEVEVRVRQAGDETLLLFDADPELVDRARARLLALLGPAVLGEGEATLALATLRARREAGLRVAFAESLTAGLASALLADVPGASEVLCGGMVTYSNELKARWLGVPREVLESVGPVSEPAARAMAEGVLARSGADLAVSLTGWAGPDAGEDGQPAGTVYFGLARVGAPTLVERRRFTGGRDEVRRKAALHALDLLRRRALGAGR